MTMHWALEELYSRYKQCDADIANLEAQIEALRRVKSDTAKAIKSEYGGGPHSLGESRLSVSSKNGFFYLRSPFPSTRPKKLEATG